MDCIDPGLMMILNHIRFVLCGNVHEQVMDMIYSIASIVQKPTRRLPVIVLRGLQGIGKNVIFEELIGKRILTPDYFIISEKMVHGITIYLIKRRQSFAEQSVC